MNFSATPLLSADYRTTAQVQACLVLIAEDQPDICDILAAYLQRNGMRTITAANGAEALEMHRQLKPDLVLLDIQMPVMDGWQVLAALRQHGDTPVMMITAMDSDLDKLTGLRIGADDYIVKPFNPAEVVARVNAVMRRYQSASAGHTPTVLRAGPLEINLAQHEAKISNDHGERHLQLTLTEFRLLCQMARAPKRVFSRAELLQHSLPEGDALERTVDSHIS
ncbi:response regulator transcription factor, partial [Undibacterium luofuense]|uniref:response regulator transcription factor n=1 Tax=Undibacterium luofuense TaxID=2828733 RepID=UPI0030ECBB4B